MNTINELLLAARFAAERHAGQLRKGAHAEPYINHPLEVAHLIANVGKVADVDIIIAGLLHDTIEDTKTSPAEISDLFGDEVLSMVLEVSDDKRLPKAERKRLQIEHASHRSTGAKLIKLADKTCNVHDVGNSPPEDWSLERRRDYLIWTEQVVAGLRGTNPALETHYDEELAKGRSLLSLI